MAADGTIRAAGTVLTRGSGAAREVVLVHRPRYDDWSFPKGKAEPGEHPLLTAVRETEEETGLRPRLGPRLPTVRYETSRGPKRVDYWAAEAVGESPFTANAEIDRWEWVPVPEALDRLSHAHDAEVLRARAALPERTRPAVLLRHASAGDKRLWRDRDLLRPLDEQGRREAAELARLLSAYAPRKAVGSATARCLESLLDYTAALRLPLVAEQDFTLGTGTPERAAARFRDLLHAVDDTDGVVVCTHGELVPALVRAACPEDALPADPELRKGAFWVFHQGADGTLVSLERHAAGGCPED